MSKITAEGIVSIMNTHRVEISLSGAFKVAADVMSSIRADRDTSYTEGYEAGKSITDYAALDASYDRGYTAGLSAGKMEAENSDDKYELNRLRKMEQKMKELARAMVVDVIREVGRDKKIACIKELRERTFLGLKESKDLVDEGCKILDIETAYAEKEAREAAEAEEINGFTETSE